MTTHLVTRSGQPACSVRVREIALARRRLQVERSFSQKSKPEEGDKSCTPCSHKRNITVFQHGGRWGLKSVSQAAAIVYGSSSVASPGQFAGQKFQEFSLH